MVPGWTERERLEAEMRRLQWLAEAALPPVQRPSSARPRPIADDLAVVAPVGLWRRGLASVRLLGQRLQWRRAPGSGLLLAADDRPAR